MIVNDRSPRLAKGDSTWQRANCSNADWRSDERFSAPTTSTQDLAGTDEFMMGFQRLLTEWAWGYAWSRPGLDRKTRSMLNLAILTALGRPQELGIYVKGALSTGVSVAEIQEVLLHATVYCGTPAGRQAFLAAARSARRRGRALTSADGEGTQIAGSGALFSPRRSNLVATDFADLRRRRRLATRSLGRCAVRLGVSRMDSVRGALRDS